MKYNQTNETMEYGPNFTGSNRNKVIANVAMFFIGSFLHDKLWNAMDKIGRMKSGITNHLDNNENLTISSSGAVKGQLRKEQVDAHIYTVFDQSDGITSQMVGSDGKLLLGSDTRSVMKIHNGLPFNTEFGITKTEEGLTVSLEQTWGPLKGAKLTRTYIPQVES